MNVIYRTRARRMRIASLVACLTLTASTLTAQAPDRSAPPPLGHHTDAILHTLGYDATSIAQLRQQGVIG